MMRGGVTLCSQQILQRNIVERRISSRRLSLALSSASAFNRRTPDTSSPPYLAFHVWKIAELSRRLRRRSASLDAAS
jgi:hypothetical protein